MGTPENSPKLRFLILKSQRLTSVRNQETTTSNSYGVNDERIDAAWASEVGGHLSKALRDEPGVQQDEVGGGGPRGRAHRPPGWARQVCYGRGERGRRVAKSSNVTLVISHSRNLLPMRSGAEKQKKWMF